MYRSLRDFTTDWAYETEHTLHILSRLRDEVLAHQPHPRVRSLGRLAWHLAQTIRAMAHDMGLTVHGPAADAPPPMSLAVLVEVYKDTALSLAQTVAREWTDDDLTQKVTMYGQLWARGYALAAIIRHQAHHRGQMTVLMRMLDLSVMGVYGPAYEQWADMGLPPEP